MSVILVGTTTFVSVYAHINSVSNKVDEIPLTASKDIEEERNSPPPPFRGNTVSSQSMFVSKDHA